MSRRLIFEVYLRAVMDCVRCCFAKSSFLISLQISWTIVSLSMALRWISLIRTKSSSICALTAPNSCLRHFSYSTDIKTRTEHGFRNYFVAVPLLKYLCPLCEPFHEEKVVFEDLKLTFLFNPLTKSSREPKLASERK